MGRLEDLKEQVGKYRCDRCWKYYLIEELQEEEETSLIVCSSCIDQQGFNEQRREVAKEVVEHHFDT